MNFKNLISIPLFMIFSMMMLNCEGTKSAQKMGNQLSDISLEAIGVGNSLKVTIDKKQTKIVENLKSGGDNSKSKFEENTNSKLWKDLNEAVENLDLNEFETWVGPTQYRLHDGARATTMTISTNGKTLTSQPFDEGNPPAELQEVYELMMKTME